MTSASEPPIASQSRPSTEDHSDIREPLLSRPRSSLSTAPTPAPNTRAPATRPAPFIKALRIVLVCFLAFFLLCVIFLLILFWPINTPPIVFDGPQDFAVGFDLNPTYVAACVIFANGTTFYFGPILASSEYYSAMYKFSLPWSQHPAPPYYNKNMFIGFFDVWRERPRVFRRSLGLPASWEVAAMAEMMRRLVPAIEATTGSSIGRAVITVPRLPALYREDVKDVLLYMGIQELYTPDRTLDSKEGLVHHTITALAGNNIALCKHSENRTLCSGESWRDVHGWGYSYAVAYYNDVMMLSTARYYGGAYWQPMLEEIDYDLGFALAAEDDSYWDRVDRLLSADDLRSIELPIQVQLFGDFDLASGSRMISTIKRKLEGRLGFVPDVHVLQEPAFTCARGAAVLARRLSSVLEDHRGELQSTWDDL